MDLFEGTAKGYTKYRGEYPEDTIKTIIAKVNANGNGRLLDIGCGDGRLTLLLAKYFKEIVAVDISPEMIEEGTRRAKEAGISNINWIIQSADNLDDSIGIFDCITIAQALHWFNAERVLSLSYRILAERGAIVLVGGKSIWNYAPTKWEEKIIEIIKKYLGPERRTVQGKFNVSQKPYDVYLEEIGFKQIDKFDYIMPKGAKTIEEVLAEQFTTSYASRALFGDKLNDFEEELKRELLKIQPDNRFITELRGEVMIGFKT